MKRIIGMLLSLIFVNLLVFGVNADAAPFVVVATVEEYNEYIQEGETPNLFLFYEDLSFLGEFDAFTIPNKSMDSYYYSFNNENGVELFLKIESKTVPLYWGDEIPASNGNFLKNTYADQYFTLNKKENIRCHSKVDQFVFVYEKTDEKGVMLTAIHWFNDELGKYFSLSGMRTLDLEKPVEGFLGDLLGGESSESARKQLYDLTVYGKDYETNDSAKRSLLKNSLWIALPVGVVAGIGGAAAIFLRRKKKPSPVAAEE